MASSRLSVQQLPAAARCTISIPQTAAAGPQPTSRPASSHRITVARQAAFWPPFTANTPGRARMPRASRLSAFEDADLYIDFYQVLGIPPCAPKGDLRQAYKALAKRTHPDIAGEETSHVFTLINRAYEVLSEPRSRLMYDSGRSLFGKNSKFGSFTGRPLSKNSKPGSPTSMFVDENSCIGCRACVYEAPNTFMMDETHGKARVDVQWADDAENIQIACEMCPVSCIHEVRSCDLAVLEYVQRSMPPRYMLIHSDQSSSGGARGMEESPFAAAERFEAKKAKLMAETEERAKAEERMRAVMESFHLAGVEMPWSTWGEARSEPAGAAGAYGPSCPLIRREPGEPLYLPASSGKC
mmetsp:Transcript_35285/g.99896  ORF Transcript_35285/g.99896 Transcript_35285/m.99896 type:complete len:355 (-) Transcript_35285:179-1243(-)